MSIILYNIFLWLYQAGIHIASLFNTKAAKWVAGRKDILRRMESEIGPGAPVIWMHCASLGEFEQGRPVLEEIRHRYPGYRLLLTFFSPSGYEAQKNYSHANWVFYMPLDGPVTARKFLAIVQPSLVIFVKYEFWYYYLKKIKYRNIPLLLISAILREYMSFFKFYGGLQRKMLSRFEHLFVQDIRSADLAIKIGLGRITSISGDTRFDRVAEIAEKFIPIPGIEQFGNGEKLLIAGSTWPPDEAILSSLMRSFEAKPLKLIIAPHEVNESNLSRLRSLFSHCLYYSEFMAAQDHNARVLIIDNIGMLSRLYNYGYITYVGGGLSATGIHNVLEAAVYGKPVIYGPNFHKYPEAVGLAESGGGLPLRDEQVAETMLGELVTGLLENEEDHRFASNAAREFVMKNRGATKLICEYIQEKRLLTS